MDGGILRAQDWPGAGVTFAWSASGFGDEGVLVEGWGSVFMPDLAPVGGWVGGGDGDRIRWGSEGQELAANDEAGGAGAGCCAINQDPGVGLNREGMTGRNDDGVGELDQAAPGGSVAGEKAADGLDRGAA